MSRESIIRWADGQTARSPKPGYCTGTSRFGPSCYDCSGFTYMAYLSDGKVIPADSSLVARWGRTNGQVHSVAQARLADLLVHDKYGDPYNSSGPRGHIGLFLRASGNRVISYESAGSGQGVGVYSRLASFWAISVQHPSFAGVAPTPSPVPEPVPEKKKGEMFRVIQGDKSDTLWLTNWGGKRRISSPDEVNAIIKAGVTDGAGIVHWPQAWVDQIPVDKTDAEELRDLAVLLEAIKKAATDGVKAAH